jgi:hypothetical protein
MATTEIASDIQNITGVTTANTGFIESSQRFVVSKVPKELLWFASTQSSAIIDSNGFDVSGSDTVLSAEREGYPAEQVPFSMSKWIDDSTSLHKATNSFPKYYLAQGKVFIKPDPSSGGSNDGYVYYVDYSQIDDDCDLRNAVIFHASSNEFTKLAMSELPTISISSSAPASVSAPGISYSNASVGDAIIVAQDSITVAVDSIASAQDGIAASVESYTGETDTISPTDASSTSASGTNSSAGTSTGSSSSDYTRPSIVTSAADGELTEMVNGAAGTDADKIDFDKWWDIAGDYIEDEEDSDLANAQLQKINSYVAAFRAEVESARSAMEATISDAQLSTQASISQNSETTRASISSGQTSTQASIASGQTATQASIANAGNDASIKQSGMGSLTSAKVAKMQSATSASVSKMQQSTSAAISKMQQSTAASIQKMVQSTTASIQKMQLSTNVNVTNAAKTLEASMSDYTLEVQNYQSVVQAYSINLQKEVSEYQNKIAKSQSYSAESNKYYQWAVSEVNMFIQNNSKLITASMESKERARA